MQRCWSPPPSQNQNRSTCAQARVTCTVNPTKQKVILKAHDWQANQLIREVTTVATSWNTGILSNQRRPKGRGQRQPTQCVYFRQYFQYCSQRTRDQWELGQKAVFKVCFKKRHKSRPLLICCPEVLLPPCFIWADWHVVLAPVVAYISVSM